MKPWLLNILACPIDKHHPLEAYFYKWETTETEIEKINREAGKPNKFFTKQYTHLVKQIEDGTISFSSFKSIKDETGSAHTIQLQIDADKFISKLEFEDKTEKNLLQRYPESIDVLYRYLNLIEVEEGLLRCPQCGRWYPIGNSVKTIPELMPDGLRDEEKDLAWLNKWIELVPEAVKTDGKPFKL
ncbi:Trm112 family protein [Thermoproteota archaeon]